VDSTFELQSPSSSASLWARPLLALTGAKLIFAVAVALAGAGGGWLYIAMVVEFGAVAAVLLWTHRRDLRAERLGAAFLLNAAPFADRLLRDHLGDVDATASALARMLLLVRVDAWLPLCLWLFVVEFPDPLSSARARAWTDRAIRASAWVGATLFVVNLVTPLVPPTAAPILSRALAALEASTPGSYYWPILLTIGVPIWPFLLWRARNALPEERRRVGLFVGGLVLGLAPMGVEVLLEAYVPPFRRLMDDPAVVRATGIFLFTMLAAAPAVTAYSVVVDRVFDLRVAIRAALRYAFARYTILGAMIGPFLALAWYTYDHREDTIARLLSGTGPALLLALGVGASVLLLLRSRILRTLDRRFFREQYDAHEILARLAEEARKTTSLAELASHVASEIDRALHVHTAALLVADDQQRFLRSPDGRVRPLLVTSGLAALIAGDEAALDVNLGSPRSTLRRLSDSDRDWLADGAFGLLVPLLGNDRALLGLLALGDKLSDLEFSGEDRRLLGTIAGSLALTLENRRLRASPDRSPGALAAAPHDDWFDAAAECHACGLVHPPATRACGCGAELRRAPVPYVLLGKFRLERRIGSGGMGVVYRAIDLTLDRAVAIKTLPHISPEYAGRLRREARAMAVVAHPNLAVIYGAEMWRGTPMLVCEYLSGGTLADRLKRRQLPIDEALRLGIVIADVLEHIHGVGLVHCDVKPSNIGFTADNTPKLLDFGLARIVNSAPEAARGIARDLTTADAAGLTSLYSTASQCLVGTPLYMSPEAIRMESSSTSFDLWSTCVLLYEAIAGACPFIGPNVFEIHAKIVRAQASDLRQIRPECPERLARFFKDALAFDPTRRPATAQALQKILISLQTELQAV
jgi:hypothetical protein